MGVPEDMYSRNALCTIKYKYTWVRSHCLVSLIILWLFSCPRLRLHRHGSLITFVTWLSQYHAVLRHWFFLWTFVVNVVKVTLMITLNFITWWSTNQCSIMTILMHCSIKDTIWIRAHSTTRCTISEIAYLGVHRWRISSIRRDIL
jgi:hypothetical protein